MRKLYNWYFKKKSKSDVENRFKISSGIGIVVSVCAITYFIITKDTEALTYVGYGAAAVVILPCLG